MKKRRVREKRSEHIERRNADGRVRMTPRTWAEGELKPEEADVGVE